MAHLEVRGQRARFVIYVTQFDDAMVRRRLLVLSELPLHGRDLKMVRA